MIHRIARILLYISAFLGLVVVVGTGLGALDSNIWWFRMWDYPRLQLAISAVIAVLGLIAGSTMLKQFKAWVLVAIALLAGAFGMQAYELYDYSPWSENMSSAATADQSQVANLTVLVSNVLQKNDKRQAAVEMVRQHQPDIVLFLETDQAWVDHLMVLTDTYPHKVSVPQDNTYGLLMLSKLPLEKTQVRKIMEKKVPSVETMIQLRDGRQVRFYGLHPKPPAPQESKTSLPRDAELLLVGEEIRETPDVPTIVAGDMNDVSWSRNTTRFLETSNTLDPRRGRGLFNTFDADLPVLRMPLDHVFHTPDFTIVRVKRLAGIHSDHFPLLVTLNLMRKDYGESETLALDQKDAKQVQGTLNKAADSTKAKKFNEGENMDVDAQR